MPINNKKYVSLVELEETASVEWLHSKSHSSMCHTEVLMQLTELDATQKHVAWWNQFPEIFSSYKAHTYMTPFFLSQQTKDGL